MITCVNCENKAIYTVTNPGTNDLDYCVKCLPARLLTYATAGNYPLRKVEKEVKKTEIKEEA
jgi:hypothetical protein